ncbi:hypothetical protein [Pontibacter burrus]|uniref:Uncharacterized protein n=1 Tax=Pontibacter burrus TaxID=2704466 RepID=A0A6B3LWA1_9BACT|nr:hypothetical protein [Pontibacter burrus]NEM99235.1 hypothetical protein [Pontibacter burrus]
MRRAFNTVLTLLAGSIFLFSCKDCDDPQVTDVTKEDMAWLVYNTTTRATFVNEKQENVLYKFSGGAIQNVPGEGYSINDECIDKLDAQAFAMLQDTTKKNLGLVTYILKRPTQLEVRVGVENRGDWPINVGNPTFANHEVGGYLYNEVYEVLQDSTKPSDVKRVLYNPTHGILYVGFYNGKFLELTR